MSKVFLTGATGFVGAHLTRRLLQDGYEVHCLVRSQDISWRLHDIQKDLQFHAADIRDADAVRRVMHDVRPKHILHLATAGVYRGKAAPDSELLETNMLGLAHMLEAARDMPYKSFINTGSSSEYGAMNVPMREDMRCNPVTVYGLSKLAGTQYASLHGTQFQKPVVTLRLFSPYGPYDFEGRFMVYAVKKSLRGKSLELGNPESRRDFIYVGDVIDAYKHAMEAAKKVPGEVYNVGSGVEVSIRTVAAEIQRACGTRAAISWGEAQALRPGESPRWQADIAKAKRDLLWEPQTSLMAGIEKTVDWFRMHVPST